jgi:hypothetical protein
MSLKSLNDCTDCQWDYDRSCNCHKGVRRQLESWRVFRIPLRGCSKFEIENPVKVEIKPPLRRIIR